MREFLQSLKNEIQNRQLVSRGQKILVAVSGGLDSMVLLHALDSLAVEMRWQVFIAHFNHQLRGRSSNADEKLVRKTAAARKLPLVVERADVKLFAKKNKLSIEMAARQLRHEFLARAARVNKISTVALAHHADDQVELFFLRVLRGAGGAGVAGMKWRSPSPADKKITLVRPLLDLTKPQLLDFARENKIPFREDATNASSHFLRNRIRNELLPLLRENYQPGLAKSVLRLMDIIGAESETVGKLAEEWLLGLQKNKRIPYLNPSPVRRKEGVPFEDLSVAVQRRVLQSQLVALQLTPDFELIESLRESAGIAISVSRDLSVSRNTAGQVNLKRCQPAEFNLSELAVNLKGRAGEVALDTTCVNWRFDARKSFKRSHGETTTEFFDADKVGSKIILRHWRAGDRFQPIGLNAPAKLQDLLTNAKIPRDRRHNLIVAATASGEIFWVEGLRISENFKLTPGTTRRLVWRWRCP